MKYFILCLFLGIGAFCNAQTEKINDCHVLESVFKDTGVINFFHLYAQTKQPFFLYNRSEYFKNCSNFEVSNYKYTVVDYNDKSQYSERWMTIVVGEGTDENHIDVFIDDEPREKGGRILLEKINGKYIVIKTSFSNTE